MDTYSIDALKRLDCRDRRVTLLNGLRRDRAVPTRAIGPPAPKVHGKDATVELGESYQLPEATVVIDALWGTPAERALEAAARGVRFVQLGQSAGPTATLQSSWVRGKAAEILGFSVFSTPHDVIAAGYHELCEHAREGRIHFAVEPFELDDIAAAWERQASGTPGAKIVIAIRT